MHINNSRNESGSELFADLRITGHLGRRSISCADPSFANLSVADFIELGYPGFICWIVINEDNFGLVSN
jgi:hypothetical protein